MTSKEIDEYLRASGEEGRPNAERYAQNQRQLCRAPAARAGSCPENVAIAEVAHRYDVDCGGRTARADTRRRTPASACRAPIRPA